ncbi:hypothetical protein CV102_23780 [Natronococcus pandeyae]|uniref:Uncharacterized protein n=1 Tax=Natronococcus pandeyae TaxID=2055836 RepID=A0A8J8PYJ3_9EURY|nr:hypothetical protein [Natronococcus pandeyae]TYL36166.1 hypothetical protein CV102_23780 [Natronococcus pandeyae]
MKFATWAYPWDLLDEGVDDAVDRLNEIGIDEINLATNYHTVQAFLPHNPERRTFFADASAYFQPGEYADVEPVPNETMGDGDWLETIASELEDRDIALNSWTVGCHNSRLGMERPELTLTNAFGDDLAFGLCPSNPAVQQYLVDLVGDLDDRDTFDRIELETFDYFYGTGFGWHHDKFHARLGPLGEFLFGVCFCDHCRSNASDAGVNVEQARAACRDTVDAIVDGGLSRDVDVAGWLRDHHPVAAYLDVRERTLVDLFADIRSAVDAELGYYVGFLSPDTAWKHGADLERLAEHVDYYTVITYESSAGEAAAAMRTADYVTPEIPLHAGILPGHPEIHDEVTTRQVVDAVIDNGAERVSFYNYGLLPDRNLDWITSATEPYR